MALGSLTELMSPTPMRIAHMIWIGLVIGAIAANQRQ